jgi:hypothetical protein
MVFMALSLNDYRIKLISKILFAASQEEVKRYIEGAMKALQQRKVNGHIIARFVDKIISELDLFTPQKTEGQPWRNITMAKLLFSSVKKQITAMAT